jgi:hypothetical protein
MMAAGFAGALTACGSPSVTLELAFPADSPLEYRLSGSLSSAIDPGSGVPSQETTLEKNGLLVLRGMDQDQSGTATVRHTLSGLTFHVGGGQNQTQPDVTSDLKFGANGRVMSGETLVPMAADPIVGLFLPLLPDRAVRLGDTWETDYAIALPPEGGKGSQQVRSFNTLRQLNGASSGQVAVVDSELSMQIDTEVDVRQQAERNNEPLNIPPNYSPTQRVSTALSGKQTTSVDITRKRVVDMNGALDIDARYQNSGFPPGVPANERITGKVRNQATLATAS